MEVSMFIGCLWAFSQKIKESKRRKSASLRYGGIGKKSPTPNSGVKFAITNYYDHATD